MKYTAGDSQQRVRSGEEAGAGTDWPSMPAASGSKDTCVQDRGGGGQVKVSAIQLTSSRFKGASTKAGLL